MAEKENIKLAEELYLLPVGCGFDLVTGNIMIGNRGESIINGGIGGVVGVFGAGNNYKSTIVNYLGLMCVSRVSEAIKTSMYTYDTECNTSLMGFERYLDSIPNLEDFTINTREQFSWSICNSSDEPMERWIPDYLDGILSDKTKSKGVVYEAFKPRFGSDNKVIRRLPVVGVIDSLSALSSTDSYDLSMDLVKGDGGQIVNMNAGLIKHTFLKMLPSKVLRSNSIMFLTAHVGEKSNITKGPPALSMPTKNLQFMKANIALKGVGKGLEYLSNILIECLMAKSLTVQGTEEPLYPNEYRDDAPNDLQIVMVKFHRNKSGLSGHMLPIVILQSQGVQKSLTEFHSLVIAKRFGMIENGKYYDLDLYPNQKITRLNIRELIDNDHKLCRAIEITSELRQLKLYRVNMRVSFPSDVPKKRIWCEPKELYQWFIDNGYDWNMILSTRGYYTINQYTNKIPMLSTVDLLKIRAGLYYPYFLDSNKKVKKEFKNKFFDF